MSDLEIVEACLSIEMNVNCPNVECDYLIDLLREKDTNGYNHNDDGALLRQMFPKHGNHEDFECDSVVCTQCKTEFNVRELVW